MLAASRRCLRCSRTSARASGRLRRRRTAPGRAPLWARWARLVQPPPVAGCDRGPGHHARRRDARALDADGLSATPGNDPAGTTTRRGVRPARAGLRQGLQRPARGRRRAPARRRAGAAGIGATLSSAPDVARSSRRRASARAAGRRSSRCIPLLPAGERDHRPRRPAARDDPAAGRARERRDRPRRRGDGERHRLHARAERQAAALRRRRGRAGRAAAAAWSSARWRSRSRRV